MNSGAILIINQFIGKQMTTSNDIKSNLDQFIGTTQYFKHQLGIHFTDGIKYLADSCQCYWLIDIVASWQFDSIVKDNDFQVYKLIVNENHSAVVRIEDGNDNLIQLQMIEFTDFPLDSITLWFTNGVLYLPSEH